MQAHEQGNWIDGEWREAASGIGYGLVARRAPWSELGSFPRSSAVDIAAAHAAATAAARDWAALSPAERFATLRRACGALELDPDLTEDFSLALGLDPDEARERLEHDLYRAREALEIAADSPAELGGAGLFLAHWSDLAGPLAARVGARLGAGATLTLVADPWLPQAAQALARALEQAGLPRGVLNLVCDDGLTAVEAGLQLGGLAWARLAGVEPRLDRLAERAPGGLPLALWPVRRRSRVVRMGEDPAAAARSVVELSLGRSATLSGQLPGQIGRVLCHQRVFARLCEELLGELERHPDVLRPVPPLEPDALECLREAWTLGLDEGATPLLGGEPWFRDGASDGGGGPGGAARGERHPRGLVPVVFTNVEPDHRMARLTRAMPALGLLRVESDAAGLELAAVLDGGVSAASVRGD